MNSSGDAAEQIVRISLEGFEVAAKITGSGAKNIAALLFAIMKDKQKTAGKTRLKNMLKSGKELKVFSVRQEDFKKFVEVAKKYGVLYSVLINKKNNKKNNQKSNQTNNNKNKFNDGIMDIMVRAEDAAKINRIVERIKMSRYDDISIRSEIERTKKEKTSKQIGVKTKNIKDKIIEEEQAKPINKEEPSLNPYLAKTEKSPQSKPSLKTQKTSEQGTKTMIKDKPSVKEKLKKAITESKSQNKSKVKSEVSKTTIKKNQKKKEKIK